MKNKKIDFVMIWVDGSDKEWVKEKDKFSDDGGKFATDSTVARYRDWDNLRYWFRGVEEFTPWVNKIYFVTCGHKPDWLNIDHSKINFVKHSEYMDSKFLPTFSSHPIELNLHRIRGLSENFVYFNDDTFFIRKTSPDVFFGKVSGLPKSRAIVNAIVPSGDESNLMPNIYANVVGVINKHFNKNAVIGENAAKWFNLRYGLMENFRTLINMPYSGFTGMLFDHLPAPFLKSTFKDVWAAELELLNRVSANRFRSGSDVNQYLMRAWQMCKGDFEPLNIGDVGRAYFLPSDQDGMLEAVEKQRFNTICINDSGDIDDFEAIKSRVIDSFEKILPNKSSFEK